MGRRSQSKGRSSGSSRSSGKSGRSSRGSSSPMPMIAGLVGVVIIGAVIFFVMNKDKDTSSEPDSSTRREVSRRSPSNLDTEVAKSNTNTTTEKNTSTVKTAPQNAYDKAKNANYDMATLRPLAEKVDRSKWDKIDAYITQAYVLKADAEKARSEGKEDEFKALASKAFKTWREGDKLFEDWQFEIQGIHRDLWDACFQKEERRYARSSKELRSYMQFENHKH